MRLLISAFLCLTAAQASIKSSDYDFTLRPGVSVAANATASVALNPCPAGIVAGDGWHWFWLTDLSSEAVKMSAFDPATCTVSFVPRFSHLAGQWALSSSGHGIPEALAKAAQNGGDEVVMPAGRVALHAALLPSTNILLHGAGRGSTVLFVPPGEFDGSPQWNPYGLSPGGEVIAAPVGVSRLDLGSFAVDMNGTQQPNAPNGSYGVQLINSTYSRLHDLEVNNCPILRAGNTCLPIGINGNSQENMVEDSYIFNSPCVISSEGSGGVMVGGAYNTIARNHVFDGCNSAYVTGGTSNVFESNTFELGHSVMVAAAQAFASDNSTGTLWIGNTCVGNGVGPNCYSSTTDAPAPDTTDTLFLGNQAINCGQAYQAQSTVARSRNIIIRGGTIRNCTQALSLTGIIEGLTVADVSGLDLGSRTIYVPNGTNEDISIADAVLARIGGASAPFVIGGFAGGYDGRTLVLFNASGQVLILRNWDTGSQYGNRICTLTGQDLKLPARDSMITLRFSSTDNCWLPIGTY